LIKTVGSVQHFLQGSTTFVIEPSEVVAKQYGPTPGTKLHSPLFCEEHERHR